MKIRLLIGLLSIVWLSSAAFADDRDQTQTQDPLRDQLPSPVQAQDQDRVQDRVRAKTGEQTQAQVGAKEQKRVQVKTGDALRVRDQAQTRVRSRDRVHVDVNGDGIPDRLQTQSRTQNGARGQGVLRGRHRQQGSLGWARGSGGAGSGRGFGAGFVDANGDGVCDNYQGRSGGRR